MLDFDVSTTQDGEYIRSYIPYLYFNGQMSISCNPKRFTLNYLRGFLHACLVFFIPLYALQETGIVSQDGDTDDLWLLSLTSFTSVVWVVNLNLTVLTRSFNFIVTTAILVPSLMGYSIHMWVTNSNNDKLEAAIMQSHNTPLFYLCVILSVGFCFLFDYFLKAFSYLAVPNPS
jgi:hypothetical protein